MGTCAALTFCRAVSSVNGGTGYLIGSSSGAPVPAVTAKVRLRLIHVHALVHAPRSEAFLARMRRKGLLSNGSAIEATRVKDAPFLCGDRRGRRMYVGSPISELT